ncbi:putative FAD-linked oxidoreductase like protein [Verticillium longisporum]|uniref:Putative FAD-linked oxidoreductase like protein n=1 Tax=Verticillium longisporum TaxID=100787 RepID=A0A8I3AKW6_VERLO|nr:putative FAD-linked oxidoreductase like protein [Verticillium longisporum]
MSTLYEPLGYGVGGLSLGGGASFHTGKRGFTCNNIVNYEIVLADGTIANANAVENSGLHRASKGGGNNFGIVTRFDLQTFEDAKGGLYGGLLFLTCDDRDAILAQFSRLVEINHEHPEDTEVIAFTYGGSGAPMIAVVTINTTGLEDSTSFAPLNQLTPVRDDRSRKKYGKVITDFASPGGASYVCSAVQNNMDVLKKISALCDAFVADLTSLWPELGIDFVIQPFPSTSPTGGMILEQESVAFAKLAALTAELGAYAESKDAATTWRYLNYVNPAQDPFSTFGEENFQFLKKVAAEYDPKAFFQMRVSGGFKISRVQ